MNDGHTEDFFDPVGLRRVLLRRYVVIKSRGRVKVSRVKNSLSYYSQCLSFYPVVKLFLHLPTTSHPRLFSVVLIVSINFIVFALFDQKCDGLYKVDSFFLSISVCT